jgi:chromosome segregation ATPase
MGKKGTNAPKPAPAKEAPVTAPVSKPTATSSSASANSYQNLIRALLSIPEGESDERNEILEKLNAEYQTLASNNRLNALKEKYLFEELALIQPKYEEVSAEATKVKTEHDAISTKYSKLRMLSQQLSERTKQADLKAANQILEEQKLRGKLTEKFSASITAISAKLDALATRRQTVVAENIKLRGLLKTYLEEYDADQPQVAADSTTTPAVEAEGGDTASSESAEAQGEGKPQAEAVEGVEATTDPTSNNAAEEASAGPTAETAAPIADSTPAAQTPEEAAAAAQALQEQQALAAAAAEAEAAEQAQMSFFEDTSRLAELQRTEAALRARTEQYAAQFDSFQSKLGGCNRAFTEAQASIQNLSKEMAKLEKDNAALSKKVTDTELSARVMENMLGKVKAEQEKEEKKLERYRALAETLLKDVQAQG